MTRLEDSIFEGCYMLETVEIPDSILSIGIDVFAGCDSLKTVYCTKGSITDYYVQFALHDKVTLKYTGISKNKISLEKFLK